MPRTGRPTKLTPALATTIANAVAAGVGVVEAAALVGVAKPTVLLWLQRGRGELRQPARRPYTDFADAVARARAVDEARRIARLEQAGRGGTLVQERTTRYPDGRVVTERQYTPPDWRSDAFHLERRYQDRWRFRVQADLTLEIQRAAQAVADELGIDVELVLREAQAYLREGKRGRPQ